MPKLEANIQFLFNEYDILDRYDRASELGFKGVELQNPYPIPTNEISERLNANGLQQVIINSPVEDPITGINNIALIPDKRDLYKERTSLAVEYAHELGCLGVNIGIGQMPEGFGSEIVKETLIENITYAATELDKVGVTALIEPINVLDQPGFFINTSKAALDVIESVGHSNLSLLYDFYHMQIMEGNLAATLKDNIGSIKHTQLADNPGRHEPGTGEINFTFLLNYLDELGYQGWVGCEYFPSSSTEASLDWARKWI